MRCFSHRSRIQRRSVQIEQCHDEHQDFDNQKATRWHQQPVCGMGNPDACKQRRLDA